LSSETILVTGGAGYIGSHACKALALAGYQPVVYDNLSRGHRWAVKWGPIEHGDIGDEGRLSEVLKKYRPSTVMHFAAFAYVGESVQDPGLYYKNNVSGTLSMLRTMIKADVKKVVFSSTCAVYGVPSEIPITEGHSKNPVSPYGKSKLIIESALEDYYHAYGLTSCSLRYFNAAGAGKEGDTGEVHEPETHLIPLVLEAAARKIAYVSVFGDDYDTKDGTCIRDYIHVSDLADAHVKALQYLENQNGCFCFNLGNGAGYSVSDVISAARKLTGREIAARIMPRRPGDPPVLVGDATLAQRELGWRSQHSSLETMISTAWQWITARNT